MSVVCVLSKEKFEDVMKRNNVTEANIEAVENTALISICSTTNSFCGISQNHYFKSNKSNVLNIRFDDIEQTEAGLLLFNEKHAEELIRFILKNLESSFIVHCTAGISRSGAVGDFIRRLKDIPYQDFVLDNPQIQPNMRVLSILIDVYNKKFK